jgi:hypothetical protein
MRKCLQKLEQQRLRFSGTFDRFGIKPAWKGRPLPTLLLLNIKDSNNKQVTEHLWFNYTKGFQALGELKQGDIIHFDARVKMYWKGYKGNRDDMEFDYPIEQDYKLSHPTSLWREKHAVILDARDNWQNAKDCPKILFERADDQERVQSSEGICASVDREANACSNRIYQDAKPGRDCCRAQRNLRDFVKARD